MPSNIYLGTVRQQGKSKYRTGRLQADSEAALPRRLDHTASNTSKKIVPVARKNPRQLGLVGRVERLQKRAHRGRDVGLHGCLSALAVVPAFLGNAVRQHVPAAPSQAEEGGNAVRSAIWIAQHRLEPERQQLLRPKHGYPSPQLGRRQATHEIALAVAD